MAKWRREAMVTGDTIWSLYDEGEVVDIAAVPLGVEEAILSERACPECQHSSHLGVEYQCTAVVERSVPYGVNAEVSIDAPFPCGCDYDNA